MCIQLKNKKDWKESKLKYKHFCFICKDEVHDVMVHVRTMHLHLKKFFCFDCYKCVDYEDFESHKGEHVGDFICRYLSVDDDLKSRKEAELRGKFIQNTLNFK